MSPWRAIAHVAPYNAANFGRVSNEGGIMEPSEPGGASSSSSGKKKSWLRWLIPRFSSRTLLVATAFCGIVLAFLGVWVKRAERQRRVSREILKRGGAIQMDELPKNFKSLPPWLTKYGDGHYFRDVSFLEFKPEHDGEILRLAAELPCLTKLRFCDHRTTLQSAKQIGKLTGLRELYAEFSEITDEMVSTWAALQKLERLQLHNNLIGDEGCRHIARFKQLRVLNLSNNPVTDAGAKENATLSYLEALGLDGTYIGDPTLVDIAKRTGLTGVDLSETRVTDRGLAQLANLTKLARLTLNRTQVTDAGLMHLQGLTELKDLQLDQTRVTTAGVQSLTALIKLEVLICSHPEEFFQDGSPHKIWPLLKSFQPGFAPGMKGGGVDESLYPPRWDIVESGLNFGVPLSEVGSRLSIHHTQLTDDVCRRIAAEKELKGFWFYKAALDDRQLDLLLPHDTVWMLYLSDTQVTDASVERMLRCPELGLLKIDNTGITADGLARLLTNPKLYGLNVSSSQLDEKSLEALARSSTSWLRLVDDNASPDLVKKLASIKSVQDLSIVKNEKRYDIDPKGRELLHSGELDSATTRLKLFGPWFDDQLLASIGECKRLGDFRAVECSITDRTIEQLTKCQSLSSLELMRVPISNGALKLLRSLSLERISLNGCSVDDEGLKYLEGMDGVDFLSLDRTQITDESIETLATLRNLRWLHIGGTKVTDEGIKRLRKKRPHCRIETGPPR